MPERRPFVGPRRKEEGGSMRATKGRRADRYETWERRIGDKIVDFSVVNWAHGGVTVRAWEHGTTKVLHCFEYRNGRLA